MGFDVNLRGILEWSAPSTTWLTALASTDSLGGALPELPADPRSGVRVEQWLEALRARSGESAVVLEGSRLTIDAWLTEDDLRDIGRGVLASFGLAGRYGARGRLVLVSADGAFGYTLTVSASASASAKSRLRALGERACGEALAALTPPPRYAPRPHDLPRPVPLPSPSPSPPGGSRLALEALLAKTRRFDTRRREEVVALLRAFGPVPAAEDVPSLLEWLDHDEDVVANGAAALLLASDRDEALAPLARRLSGRHRYAAVAATFKRAPSEAFDALSPHLRALAGASHPATLPAIPKAVLLYLELGASLASGGKVRGAAFDFARFDLPADVWARDSRWADLVFDLSAIDDPTLSMPRLLHAYRDPRARRAFDLAGEVVGLERVEAQLRFDRLV